MQLTIRLLQESQVMLLLVLGKQIPIALPLSKEVHLSHAVGLCYWNSTPKSASPKYDHEEFSPHITLKV